MSPPSPPTARKSPPTLRGGDKRDVILEAAIDLFVERGFYGTAVPEIADRAGVGAGTIYRYFASKEALVNALYQQFKSELTGRVLKDFPVDKPARQMIHHLWTALAAFVKERPRVFAFLELHHHGSYLDAESNQMERRMLDLAVRFLEAAQARGEVKAHPPMLLISIVYGAFIGMVRKAWEGLLELTPETIAQGETCAWEAIRA